MTLSIGPAVAWTNLIREVDPALWCAEILDCLTGYFEGILKMEGASGLSQVIASSRKYGDKKIPVVTATHIDPAAALEAAPAPSVILHVHIYQKYIQIQHGYELIYLVCIWKRYIQICTLICTRYSQVHIGYRLCIWHMHIAVYACMCLYHAFLCSVSCAYVSVCQIYSTRIRADIYRYALSGGVHICMYLTVFLYGIHAHMHSCIQCISACICLYFDPEYVQICISAA